MMGAYEAQHPKHKNKRGFAQISHNGKIIDLDELSVGDTYEAMSEKIVVTSKVVAIIKL
jgi:exodeoxyribonuclease VII large subunit